MTSQFGNWKVYTERITLSLTEMARSGRAVEGKYWCSAELEADAEIPECTDKDFDQGGGFGKRRVPLNFGLTGIEKRELNVRHHLGNFPSWQVLNEPRLPLFAVTGRKRLRGGSHWREYCLMDSQVINLSLSCVPQPTSFSVVLQPYVCYSSIYRVFEFNCNVKNTKS